MSQTRARILVKLIGLGLLTVFLGFSLGKLPLTVGKGDFRAYWSASYLLGHGQNFTDESLLLITERELTGFNKDYAMKTWNPPWVLVWLLPYTWVRFDIAASLWLMTNIIALLFSIVVSWQMLLPKSSNRQMWLWLPMLAAVLFPSTIVSLFVGQVNLLVLSGIVGFLVFYKQERDIASGLTLALTTFKPHLVYLVIPIMLLHSLRQRRLGVLIGFLGILFLSTTVVFALRPTFFTDYFQGTTSGNLLAWETATAVTYLSLKTGWVWVRLVAMVLLPLGLLLWFYRGGKWGLMKVAQVGIIISIITMPFGWSYDFVLLLLPLTQILVWLITKSLFYGEKLVLIVIILSVYTTYYLQRIATPSELYFFWVPLVFATIYGWTAWRVGEKNLLENANEI